MLAPNGKVRSLRYKSSNGHTVTVYGRLFFTVTSASRKGLIHFVDLEPFEQWASVCNCEAWRWGERPCRHIAACFEALSVWGEIPEQIREEWIERLMFLLNMGHTFLEALQSPSLTVIHEKSCENLSA